MSTRYTSARPTHHRGLLGALATMTALAAAALSCGSGEKPGTSVNSSVAAAGTGAPASGFGGFLQQHGLTFEAPAGYEPVDVKPSERWKHEHALRSSKFKLEVRYGAAPKEVDEQLRTACGGAPCPAVPSDAALNALLNAALRPIAKDGKPRRAKPFPLDAVREEFSAHWGGVAAFDADPAFSEYKQSVAVVIHREGKPTAMFVTLYDEHSGPLEDEWMRAFHSLRFAEPFAPAQSAALASALSGTAWRCDNGFVQMKFLPSTWTLIHVSAAMAAMGNSMPYETAYHEVTYLPGSEIAARAIRVDNMEQGDRTPKQPAPEERFKYSRQGDKLTFELGDSKKWECELLSKR
jgi:hypothetical protein